MTGKNNAVPIRMRMRADGRTVTVDAQAATQMWRGGLAIPADTFSRNALLPFALAGRRHMDFKPASTEGRGHDD